MRTTHDMSLHGLDAAQVHALVLKAVHRAGRRSERPTRWVAGVSAAAKVALAKDQQGAFVALRDPAAKAGGWFLCGYPLEIDRNHGDQLLTLEAVRP